MSINLQPAVQDGLPDTDSALITPLSHLGRDGRESRILHVDDEPDQVDLSRDLIESMTENVVVATETSAGRGLERIEDEPIDCIISDYDMPEMNGLEFLDQVRENDPSLPFILFTGKGSEEVASDAIARGVTDYLQKEVGMEQYEVLANRAMNAIDQNRTHEELFTALSWYQRLVEQELAGIYLVKDAEFVYVNEKFAEIFGYAQSEVIGESVTAIVHERDVPTVIENLQKRERGEANSIRYQWTGVTKDGEEIDIECQGGTIEHDGRPAILGTLINVSKTN